MEQFVTFLIYIFVIIFMSEMTTFSFKIKSKGVRLACLLLVVCASSLLIAYRGHTGTDSSMYMSLYNDGINSVFRWSGIEGGFVLLMNISHFFGLSLEAFFFIVGAFTTSFALCSIERVKKIVNIRISSMIYFSSLYFYAFNIMRQSLAISICLYAMVLYFQDHRIISIFLILLASQFHYSAYICLFIIIARIFLESSNKFVNLTFMLLTFFILILLIVHRQFLADIIMFLTDSEYYAGYVSRNAYTNGSFLNYYIKNLFVFIIAFLYEKKYYKTNYFHVLFVIMICGYLFSSLGAILNTQIGRLGLYFTSLNIFVMGFCCNYDVKIFGKYLLKKEITSSLVYISFLGIFILDTFLKNYNSLVPYNLFLM